MCVCVCVCSQPLIGTPQAHGTGSSNRAQQLTTNLRRYSPGCTALKTGSHRRESRWWLDVKVKEDNNVVASGAALYAAAIHLMHHGDSHRNGAGPAYLNVEAACAIASACCAIVIDIIIFL